MKFRKKPVVIEATQWFKNGDHPQDDCRMFYPKDGGQTKPFLSEGKVVRYYRHPVVPGKNHCRYCNDIMHNHGWIDTKEGGHIVCPGDWIITGMQGEFYPCKPDIFEATYESANSKSKDNIFINHIQSHLESNQKVICKICGKTATEIIEKESND